MNLSIFKPPTEWAKSDSDLIDEFTNKVSSLYTISNEGPRIKIIFWNKVYIKFYTSLNPHLLETYEGIMSKMFPINSQKFEKFPYFKQVSTNADEKNFLSILTEKFPEMKKEEIFKRIKIIKDNEVIFGTYEFQNLYENEGGTKFTISFGDFFKNTAIILTMLEGLCAKKSN